MYTIIVNAVLLHTITDDLLIGIQILFLIKIHSRIVICLLMNLSAKKVYVLDVYIYTS